MQTDYDHRVVFNTHYVLRFGCANGEKESVSGANLASGEFYWKRSKLYHIGRVHQAQTHATVEFTSITGEIRRVVYHTAQVEPF